MSVRDRSDILALSCDWSHHLIVACHGMTDAPTPYDADSARHEDAVAQSRMAPALLAMSPGEGAAGQGVPDVLAYGREDAPVDPVYLAERRSRAAVRSECEKVAGHRGQLSLGLDASQSSPSGSGPKFPSEV